MKSIFTLICTLMSLLPLASCAYMNVKNATGDAITVTFDGGNSQKIETGSSYKLTNQVGLLEPAKTFLLKASGNYLATTSTNIKIDGTKDVEVKFEANQGAVKVVNTSGRTIIKVYITKSTDTSWGANLLAGNTIGAGLDWTIGIGEGEWDILIYDTQYVGAYYKFKVTIANTSTRTWGSSSLTAPEFLMKSSGGELLKK